MRRARSRRIFLAGVVAGLVALLIGGPFLVPVERIRARLERILASYAQEDVRLDGVVKVRMFPAIGVEFRDIRAVTRAGGRLLLAADRGFAAIDMVPFLLGRSPITAVTLERPVLHVRSAPDAAAMISRAWLARLSPVTLGLSEGTIRVEDRSGDEIDRLDELNLNIRWPRTGAHAEAAATFHWRGEAFSVSGQGVGPAELAAGISGSIAVSITSPLQRVTFAGQAIVVDRIQLDGLLSVSSSRPTELARLLVGDLPPGVLTGRLDLDARLRMQGQSAQLSNLTVRMGDTLAEGVLALNWEGERPQLRGTLDLPRLDLASATVLPPLADFWRRRGWSVMEAGDLDLRLSVNRARLDDIGLRRLAATLVVYEGRATMQLGEIHVFGGEATGMLRIGTRAEGRPFELQARFGDGSLRDILALLDPASRRSGTVSGQIHLTGRAIDDLPSGLVGDVALRLAGGDFVLTERGPSSGGDDPARRRHVVSEVTLAARLQGAQAGPVELLARAPPALFTLSGSLDLAHRTLQMSGVETLESGDGTSLAPRVVRISGPLTAPVLSSP